MRKKCGFFRAVSVILCCSVLFSSVALFASSAEISTQSVKITAAVSVPIGFTVKEENYKSILTLDKSSLKFFDGSSLSGSCNVTPGEEYIIDNSGNRVKNNPESKEQFFSLLDGAETTVIFVPYTLTFNARAVKGTLYYTVIKSGFYLLSDVNNQSADPTAFSKESSIDISVGFPTSASISAKPQTAYVPGESFDPTGLSVTVALSDEDGAVYGSDTQTVTYNEATKNLFSFSILPGEELTQDDEYVLVYYLDYMMILVISVDSDNSVWEYAGNNRHRLQSDENVENNCDFIITSVVTPTCTDDGCVTYTCKYCGNSYSDSTGLVATGHKWEPWTDNKDTSFFHDGTVTRCCENCDETETKTVEDSAYYNIIIDHLPMFSIIFDCVKAIIGLVQK